MQKVIGLAGHIDHGKTALVKAITGVDTDQLEEEKRRGVTIDIGIAFYNDEVTFIDVPGHEKFIKNMVTGVSTVDAALLVIAADDGIMPQTREHLDILQILGVRNLIVALNKIDLVDPDWLEMVTEEIREFLEARGFEHIPIIAVSAAKSLGIELLKRELDTLIHTLKPKDSRGLFRLPIDRVFTVKGFGTVVTGTVLSHELIKSQNVELFPQEIIYPVRGLQSHNQDVNKVKFGDRGAINLGGASVDELGRGAFLGSPGMFQTGNQWLVHLEVLSQWQRTVKEADRVHVHVGTGKREARVHLLEANQCQPGQSMWAQLYFDEPVAANFQEKVVIRFLSPEETLGGATLYWIVERRLKKGDSKLEVLKTLDSNDLAATIHTLFLFFQAPMTRKEIARRISQAESKIHSILLDEKSFIQHQSNYLNRASFDDLLHDIVSKLENYQQNEPLGKGLSSEDLVAGNRAMGEFVLARALEDGVIKNQGNLWQLSSHPNDLEEAEENMRRGIRAIFEEAAYSSPALSSVKSQLGSKSDLIIQWMIQNGDLVRIDREYYILDTQLEHFITALKSWFKEHQELSVGEFREIIPTSRKYLLPLLNYAERKGILIRVGDVRSWAGEELN